MTDRVDREVDRWEVMGIMWDMGKNGDRAWDICSENVGMESDSVSIDSEGWWVCQSKSNGSMVIDGGTKVGDCGRRWESVRVWVSDFRVCGGIEYVTLWGRLALGCRWKRTPPLLFLSVFRSLDGYIIIVIWVCEWQMFKIDCAQLNCLYYIGIVF